MPRVPVDVASVPRGRIDGKLIRFAPSTSGVYFVWSKGKVVYVGESIDLSARVTAAHSQIREGDCVSWLERPLDHLLVDECFYIWLLKPERNGELASPKIIRAAKALQKRSQVS